MKSTVNNKPCKAVLPFPKLRRHNLTELIVLFNASFDDFTGSVCLENE